MIRIINCKMSLEAMGIYMEQIGSGAMLGEKLTEKVPYLSWEYNFPRDELYISVDEGIEIPNLSEFGEVVDYGNSMG
jgi:hypothetical protein